MTDLNRSGLTLHTSAQLDSSNLTSEPMQYPYVCPDSSASPEIPETPETSPVPVLGSSDANNSIQQHILLVNQAGPSSRYCGMWYVWPGQEASAVPGHLGLTRQS